MNKLTPLKLLTLCYPVIPSGGGESGKAPLVKWQEYQTSDPTELDLENWENNLHPSLWGIVTGQMSGIVVVDLDKPELKAMFDAEGLSPHIKTPRGGYHYWFRHPGTPVKTMTGILDGIDIRGDGGFVNVIGKRADGEYETLIVPAPDMVYPWEKLPAPIKEALDNKHTSLQGLANNAPREKDWVASLMQGVPEGQRNDSGIKLAGYYRNLLPLEQTLTILTDWNGKNTPPMPDSELTGIVNQAYRLPEHTPLNTGNLSIFNNTKYRNLRPENENSLEKLQVTQQVGDKLREYGDLATPFDKFLKENPEPHWKRDVAEIIGTSYKDRSFQALVRRRAIDDHQIRILHGGDKIQWVNKDWRSNLISLDAGKRTQLGLKLPFGMEKYVGCSERSQIVVAGDIGSGKTHYGYLFAELNIGKISIRHFVNEMGDSKAVRNLEDFSLLREHYGEDYFLISQDRENLDVTENLDPDGLNIYDYLRMSDNKEWYLSLQKTLATLSAKLDKGIMVVMIQKKKGQELGYGGEGTRMQAETYLSLNVVKNVVGDETKAGYKLGRIDILKCREWAEGSRINPEGLSLEYRTAPKHGKLIPESLNWSVMERN